MEKENFYDTQMRHDKSKAVKYMAERLCEGGDCTAKSQMFLIAGAVEKVATMYAQEQFDRAINRIRKQANINGIKGLCAKEDVLTALKNIRNEEFPT